MKKLAILLASLCVIASATGVFETPTFLQIKEDPFGRSVAALVQMNMAQNGDSGRLNDIAEVLNTISGTLKTRAAHNDDEIQRERALCDTQLEQLREQHKSSSADLGNYVSEQETKTETQSTLQASQVTEKETLAQNTATRDSTQTALDNENSRYEASQKDYSDAIAACEHAQDLLSTLHSAPTSFIQSKAKFGAVVTLLQKHLVSKSSPLIQPVLNVLTELASSAQQIDQSQLSKIISLIDQLLDDLRLQKATDSNSHDTSVAQLTDSISNLNTLIKNSDDNIASNDIALGTIAARLTQLEELIGGLNVYLGVLDDQLHTTTQTCDGYETDYFNNKTKIESQLNLLQRIRDYFVAQVAPSVENIDNGSYQDTLTVEV